MGSGAGWLKGSVWVKVRCVLTVVFVCVTAFVEAGLAQTAADEAVVGNPLEFDIATIKRGRQLFTMHCVTCHGVDGRGDTEMREFLKTSPSDLTDHEWLYGGGAAQIFDVVARGRTARDMPAFGETLSDERIWQIIHYIEFLGGRRP